MKNYLSIFLAVIIVSCNEGPDQNGEDQVIVDSIAPPEVSGITVATPHQLQLNNGLKWKISKGMRNPIEKINKLVSKFEENKVVDYQLLGDDIGKQTDKIIKKCDMKGQAHEELHKWLLPFLDLKEAMVMTSSPEEGAAILKHIKTELVVLKAYFE